MSNTPKSPLAGIIAAIITAELLAARAKRTEPVRPGGLPPDVAAILPPELRAIFGEKCGDPTCDGCYPAQASADGATSSATSDSNASDVGQGTEDEHRVFVSEVTEVDSDVAELVGIGPDINAGTLDGHTRLLAAAFITNLRKLGEQPEGDFPRAGAKLAGINYAEKAVLSALHTFTSLAK